MRGTREVQHGALTVHDGFGLAGAARGAQNECRCIDVEHVALCRERRWVEDSPVVIHQINAQHRHVRSGVEAGIVGQRQRDTGCGGDSFIARLRVSRIEQ